MISNLLTGVLLGVFLADLLERRFPDEFKSFITDITLNAIYCYSKLQIYFSKINKKLNNYIESNPKLLEFKNKLDSVIGPSKIMVTEFIKNGELLNIIETDEKNFDFGIISTFDNEKRHMNKKIIYNKEEKIEPIERSEISFILVELKLGDNLVYKINLKTDDYNFYLVGNKFTKEFFIYYLKFYLKINDEIHEREKITLKIIDHDVNTFTLDFTDKNESIILDKTGYTVSVTNHCDN
jgi:hypothetical protein